MRASVVVDLPLFADAAVNIECSVIDAVSVEGITYYFGRVEHAWATAGGMTGRILSADAKITFVVDEQGDLYLMGEDSSD